MPDLSGPDTRVRPIPKSIAARMGEAVRYAITGIAPETWFGPMQPLKPVAPEGTGGRRFDYPPGYNLQYQPRYDEPFSFATLRGLADTCDMLRLVIETRKDQIEAQTWDVRPRKQADGTHPKASAYAAEIAAARDFFASPDKERDLASWLRGIAEELFVTDAVSIYLRPDRRNGIFAFEQIDGATIAPRIDAWGRTPRAPDVAYQQILHGVPAADFSTDDLVYLPRNRRPGHVYGYSPVEQVIATANILVRRSAHQLSWYTDGNFTEGLFLAPTGWNMDEVQRWQDSWDAKHAGNLQARRRGMWVPAGIDFKVLKQPDLKDSFDEFLARIICFAFSISPQPFVSMMNRATAESAHDAATAEGLLPVLNYFARLFRVLFDRMGWNDIEMVPIDDRESDPRTADEIDVADVKAGIRTINEVRAGRGLDPVAGGDLPMLATGGGYVPLHGQQENTNGAQQGMTRNSLGVLRKDWEPDLHPRWPADAPDSQGGQFAPKDADPGEFGLNRDSTDSANTLQVAANGPFVPRGQTARPVNYNPLDPKGINKPLVPAEIQAVTNTLNALANGTHADVAKLQPHEYENRPSATGAQLPPAPKGYTTFDVNLGAKGRGPSRLIIDNATGKTYYTNNHYLTFYEWNITP